jgi:hypothetical protein
MHVKHLNVAELMWELDYQGPRKVSARGPEGRGETSGW